MGAVIAVGAPAVAGPLTGAGAGVLVGRGVQVYIIQGVQARIAQGVLAKEARGAILLPTDSMFRVARLGRRHDRLRLHLTEYHPTAWSYNASAVY